MLTYVLKKLKDQAPFSEIKSFIRENVLNWLELNDLQYHAKILKLLKEQQNGQITQTNQQENKAGSPD